MNLTIEKNLQVAMRDGVLLATDVYRPQAGQPLPVVLLPAHNKEQPALLFLAGDILRIAQGYAVVQDCRGPGSPAKFAPFFQEADDGYDHRRAAAQPWSNGKVGTMGASCTARRNGSRAAAPPALAAMAPFITTDQYYDK